MNTAYNLNGLVGIYAAIHRQTGICYVGSSVNVGFRRNAHLGSSRRGGRSRFHNAIREFGEDSFDFELLEECEKEHLLERERFYIVFLDSSSIAGLNVREKPVANYDMRPSDATRQRQRAAKIGKKLTAEHCKKLREAPRKSKKRLSPEHRAKLSEAHKKSPKCIAWLNELHAKALGKKQTPEHVEKKAAALRGRKRPAYVTQKISESQRGKTMSLEARENMKKGWVQWRINKAAKLAQTLLPLN